MRRIPNRRDALRRCRDCFWLHSSPTPFRQSARLGQEVYGTSPTRKAIIDRDASVQWTIGAIGSPTWPKVNQEVVLAGRKRCRSTSQRGDVHRRIVSISATTRFSTIKRRILQTAIYSTSVPHCKIKSRIVWRGMIKVDPLRTENRWLSAKRQFDP